MSDQRFASGGYVEPPKGDSVPHLLLKGEYWVNADTYARYRHLFKAMGYDVRPYPELKA